MTTYIYTMITANTLYEVLELFNNQYSQDGWRVHTVEDRGSNKKSLILELERVVTRFSK